MLLSAKGFKEEHIKKRRESVYLLLTLLGHGFEKRKRFHCNSLILTLYITILYIWSFTRGLPRNKKLNIVQFTFLLKCIISIAIITYYIVLNNVNFLFFLFNVFPFFSNKRKWTTNLIEDKCESNNSSRLFHY